MATIGELWFCRRQIGKGVTAISLPAGLLPRMSRRFFIGEPGLHLFCGDLRIPRALNVDIRAEAEPDIVATGAALPFSDNTFAWVFADPPYSDAWADKFWGTGPVRLYKVQREIIRVTKPGGTILFLDLRPWGWPKGVKTEAYIGVMAGPRCRLRLLHVLRKPML